MAAEPALEHFQEKHAAGLIGGRLRFSVRKATTQERWSGFC
jgi:hypothetical protein